MNCNHIYPALATLAALGLAAALPQIAQAQSLTLNSGDNVTVSGAGTVGTINNTPVANTTTSYSDGGTSPDAVFTQGSAAFTLAAGGKLSSSGSDHTLDAGGSGTITISGGSISADSYDLYDGGSGSVTVTGGAFTNTDGAGIGALGSGPVLVSGGTFTSPNAGAGLEDGGFGHVTVSGGTFSSGLFGTGIDAEEYYDGSLTVSGGSFSVGNGGNALYENTLGTVTISGGSFTTGAGGVGLNVQYGTLDLFSLGDTPFLIDGVPMNNTTLGNYTSGTDTISGTLLDGQKLDTTFIAGSGSGFELNVGTAPALPTATPEPSQSAALGLGALSLFRLVVRARRRCTRA